VRRRHQWGLLVAVAVLALAVVYLELQRGRTSSALERTLRDIGFYPIRPPSKLVGPGSIYHVSRDGRFYTTVCEADETRVSKVIRDSPSEEMIARELQNTRYALDGNPASLINAKLESNVVESIAYSLSNVAVLEIPLDKNEEIFVQLTENEGCRRAVDRLLANREFVCQGQAVLIASVEYHLNAKSGRSAEGALDPQKASVVKEVIEASVEGNIDLEQGRFVSGTGLHYGVKVNPTCVARPSDRYPRYLPRNALDRFVNWIRLDVLGG